MRPVRPPRRLLRVLDPHAHLRELPVRARDLQGVRELPPWRQRRAEREANNRDPRARLRVILCDVSTMVLSVSHASAPVDPRVGCLGRCGKRVCGGSLLTLGLFRS